MCALQWHRTSPVYLWVHLLIDWVTDLVEGPLGSLRLVGHPTTVDQAAPLVGLVAPSVGRVAPLVGQAPHSAARPLCSVDQGTVDQGMVGQGTAACSLPSVGPASPPSLCIPQVSVFSRLLCATRTLFCFYELFSAVSALGVLRRSVCEAILLFLIDATAGNLFGDSLSASRYDGGPVLEGESSSQLSSPRFLPCSPGAVMW